MASPYKIRVSKVGISTDLFQIMYNVTGNSNLVLADTPCGGTAVSITGDELIAGYTVMLPGNAINVFIVDSGGICDGRSTVITL